MLPVVGWTCLGGLKTRFRRYAHLSLWQGHGVFVQKRERHIIKTAWRRYPVVLKKLVLLVLAVMLGVGHAWCQYDVTFSHYYDMEPSFNPGAVGKQSCVNVTAAYALDMAGFEHNPRTMYVAADMPFYLSRAYHGVGVQLLGDKLGLFTHQRLSLQYAHKCRLLGGRLSAGVQAGMLSEKFDGSKLDAEEGGDPALPQSEVSGSGLDLAFGLYYEHGAWYAGVSVQHLTAPSVSLGDTYNLKIDRTYYLTGGYNIRLRNPFVTIKPSVLVRTDGTAYRADVGGRVVYTHEKRMLYGGVSCSPTHSVTFLVGGSFHGVVLGYSYELYTSAINPGNGSHELFVGFRQDINLVKKGKNKHKSVRIL